MTKRAVRQARRSGTRACEICERTCLLVEHHIHGREVRNANAGWNITAICATCHDEVHTGLKVIEGWHMTTRGRKLIWHHRDEPAILPVGG